MPGMEMLQAPEKKNIPPLEIPKDETALDFTAGVTPETQQLSEAARRDAEKRAAALITKLREQAPPKPRESTPEEDEAADTFEKSLPPSLRRQH